jgi:protein SCO1/2
MSHQAHPDRARSVGFFDGPGFPIFVFSTLLAYEVFLGAVLATPPGGEAGWGRFVQDFRIWCFNYDPRTGYLEWASVFVMLFEPVSVGLIVALVWRGALRELRHAATWRLTWPHWTGGMLVTTLVVGVLVAYSRPEEELLLPFPGERIRTHFAAPAFALTDQRGAPVSLADYRGHPVLITGVYAYCSTACPQILQQVQRTLAGLPPEVRREVSVLALSLNPEYDTRQLMAAVTEAYGFAYPEFRYANGDPATVNALLERLQFARMRNRVTGQIEHSNLFLLVDRAGEIAYRFSLNPQHAPWLHAALQQLAAEAPPRAL